MERKYQVFISSTFEDLKEERKEIIQALLEMDCIPTGMEMFQASDDSQWELIKNVISSCDYYIVIIAGRYGSVHPITKISYTQKEYEYAAEIGIPIIAFLYKNINDLPSYKVEKNKKNQKKLLQFRELAKNKMVRFWSDKSELASVVSRSIYKITITHPRNGWVRYDNEINHINTMSNTRNLIENTLDEVKEKTISEIKSQIAKQFKTKHNKEVEFELIFWKKYKFYQKCIQDIEYSFSINHKLILGKFHIDALKEITHFTLTSGIGAIALFFELNLTSGYTNISFCSDINDIKNIINYNENTFFSTFDCITPACICVNFYDNILENINYLYSSLETNGLTKDAFFKSALCELGSIFSNWCLESYGSFIEQEITVRKYGLDKKIIENDFFENNNQYMVCELQDSDETGQKNTASYFILNIKYVKLMFEICDLFI